MCYNTNCKDFEYRKGGQTDVGNSINHINSFVRMLDILSDFLEHF